MLTLLFYQPQGEDRVSLSDLADSIESLASLRFDLADNEGYRVAHWRDSATGASCVIDVGDAPVEQDHMHPPRAYAGWQSVPLIIQIPLAGPHWLCVEALRIPEMILHAHPDWRALDTEDTIEEDQEQAGPADWNRPRVIASFERQRDDRWPAGGGPPHMARRASMLMWRYRRGRTQAQLRHPSFLWPDALALLDRNEGATRSAALWLDPSRPTALPPVELIVVTRGSITSVVRAADLLEHLATTSPAPVPEDGTYAMLVNDGRETLNHVPATGWLLSSRFSSLGDEDWVD